MLPEQSVAADRAKDAHRLNGVVRRPHRIKRLLAVAVVARAMDLAGTYLVSREAHVSMTEFPGLPYPFYVQILVVSNLIWLLAACFIARHSIPLWHGLLVGLASPLVGALGVPFSVPTVL